MDDFEPLRIGILTSETAPGLARLIADPNRGATFVIAGVVGSETALREAELVEDAQIPLELRPIRQHLETYRNLRARADYDAELADLFLRLDVDYIVLDGYRYILTAPLLAQFETKVLAIHDADLSLRTSDGMRLYAGPHAVRDAILAGEPETRSSVYLVTSHVARGPLFLLGAPYPVAPMALDARERGDADFLVRYADLHRRWMHASSWGEMLSRTIELLAGGRVQVIGDVVWIDGAPGPCRSGEAPRGCHEPEAMVARGIPRSCPFIA